MTHASRHDGRVHSCLSSQSSRILRVVGVTHHRCGPELWWDQCVARTGIGLVLGLVLGAIVLLILRACWPIPSGNTQTKE